MRATTRSGLDYLATITDLLQRVRLAHPSFGLYQAAELQFWWGRPRRTDDIEQLFWLDDDERPVAAAVLIDFDGGGSLLYESVTFCPLVLPDASQDQLREVVTRGLAHAATLGFSSVELEVAHDNHAMRAVLAELGFELKAAEVLVECWLDVDERQPVPAIAEGYRLTSRAETSGRPHHMTRSPDEDLDERLAQLSLYDDRLDLVVLAADDAYAAYGLFWFDPVTNTGTVEPMRTLDDHQQRGLARHVLTSGVELLAQAGATRVSIGYEPENPASGHLYRSVGFVPVNGSDLFSGPTR